MNKNLLYLHQKVELHRYMMNMYNEALCDEYTKLETIKEAWDDEQEKDSVDWLNMPTTEQIFNRRVIDNGDRFHHYDRDGYKRNRRIGRFDNNYHNAEIASKRQANLDRIARWAILDRVKQDVIDDFIIKYDLSAIEIARFEHVMVVTHNAMVVHVDNMYDDSWYNAHYKRFNSNVPFEKS